MSWLKATAPSICPCTCGFWSASVKGSLPQTERRTPAVGRKSMKKRRKKVTWASGQSRRRLLLELQPGRRGKPRLSSASRANHKKGAEMFGENPRGFRSARWGDDETLRNSGVIARSCHRCCSFHAIVMSPSNRSAALCFPSAAVRGCTALRRSLIYFSSEVCLIGILFSVCPSS